jgi:hypothetical protein
LEPGVIRDHLSCEADFPWIGPDDPVEANPPGRELAEFIQARLQPHATRISDVWNEEGFGWSFNSNFNRVTINVLVESDEQHWLIVCSIVSVLQAFLRRRRCDAELSTACERIDQLVRSDKRFRNIQWFTRQEYEERPVPESRFKR